MKHYSSKFLIIIVMVFSISLVTSFILSQLFSAKNYQKELAQQQILQEAKAHFQGIVDTRTWNAQYGGVYVKAINGLKANPHLKQNTLLTDKNETLLKINPAWMTRQISEISNANGDYKFRITSLKPLNPSNIADKFEVEALKYFDENPEKKYYSIFNNKTNNFNFMGSLDTEKSCLECHRHQGYKVGDIRGGIKVSIPLGVYAQQMQNLESRFSRTMALVVIISILLMLILYFLIIILFKRKREMEHAKTILEKKVSKRTKELQIIVSHEQHLKNILKIATEINEMLIESNSTRLILREATSKLAANETYSLVLSGLVFENNLEVVAKSNAFTPIISENRFEFEKSSDNFIVDAIFKATILKHSIIEKVSKDLVEENSGLEWMIALPLSHNHNDDVHGVISIFTNKESGFEVEEMKILENIAHDISIAIYSHKQKDSILAMEKEKAANYEETILAFVNIIEKRDTYTAGHTIRVADYCAKIAKQMGYAKDEINLLERAAILHDIGKVATPDAILLKPGKLSHLEFELIKQHSEVGADMLERITIYKDLATIIRYHHSRYDGKGYPRTSSPDEIPMLSHIMIIADAFDAMTTNRIYRPRKTISEAFEELKHAKGTQFHPAVVEATLIALKGIKIDATSQLPTSELERRRMAYFFKDSLTGLYNEDYLQTVLNREENPYVCINVINLERFRLYNKNHGWEEGNRLLKNIAQKLTETFRDSLLTRYHGDDFIVLSKIHLTIDAKEILAFDILKNTGITVHIAHYDNENHIDYESFKKLENI